MLEFQLKFAVKMLAGWLVLLFCFCRFPALGPRTGGCLQPPVAAAKEVLVVVVVVLVAAAAQPG
jgi:hypothetical protein